MRIAVSDFVRKGVDMAGITTGSDCGAAQKSSAQKRNPNLPIRVTAQFVRVSDTPSLSLDVAADIAAQHAHILRVSQAYGEHKQEDGPATHEASVAPKVQVKGQLASWW